MELPRASELLSSGTARAVALQSFRDCCNTRTTLFVTEKWFAPKRDVLLRLLSDPITDDQAQALREALAQAASLEAVIEWLGSPEALGWREFQNRKAKRKEQAEIYAGFPWADVDACRLDAALQDRHALKPALLRENTPSCKLCGAGFDQLACFYFETPRWTWENLCGRAGWLVVCDACRVQVKFHLELLN